ncbi:lysophospholipid acyltransferase family protein [Acuticoccus sp. MNP-M23]|uniref:lysophospholipid acyltransferase family protein n=1 Tax=Acuticoccus sp. MNP-M23 TaxID=3072793 RepID=UPI0028159003|nr:lysophospholipid acyltransferase family protein [Acuticoccus sp. MNP-M23]WMS43250.1 lysophospholipid acyltransferase family protein [Acuticoccus sp. MNP-M23]
MQNTVSPPPADQQKLPERSGIAHAVALVRSVIYSVVATLFFIVMSILFAWVMLFPARRTRLLLQVWTQGDMLLLRIICGQKIAVLGLDNLPDGPALIASKHQAAWETLALVPMLPRGVVILKKELLSIPLYGWYARYYGMIPVDRGAGTAALKQLAVDAKAAVAKGFQIVIFPEGTRRPVGAPPAYKPGAVFLYDQLRVPMVPVALNSGVLWPHKQIVRYPGTITVSFLPPIPPGLPRAEIKARMEVAIERETDRLVAEALAGPR